MQYSIRMNSKRVTVRFRRYFLRIYKSPMHVLFQIQRRKQQNTLHLNCFSSDPLMKLHIQNTKGENDSFPILLCPLYGLFVLLHIS